jgi:mannitol/fructose-specific phosphotransferase system IIA component (Ntr-type)
MELREFFSEDAIKLDLAGTTKDDVLRELISLLKLDESRKACCSRCSSDAKNLGSTGIGRGIAIPHCRSLVVNKLRVAFGRKKDGVDFKAIDEKPVHFFFLIVAPPLEVSNQYLPVLGKIAQFSKESDVPQRLLRSHRAEAVPRAARGERRLVNRTLLSSGSFYHRGHRGTQRNGARDVTSTTSRDVFGTDVGMLPVLVASRGRSQESRRC